MTDQQNIINQGVPSGHIVGSGKRIIIAGGGTGGHIFPAVAIANAIKKIAPETEILFVGANGKMEMEKVPQAGYEIKGLDIAGYNRSSLIKNVFLPFKIIKSFYQVSKIFKSFQPSAVIGVGGYSSFPVLRYAQTKGIPSFIHESNSFAGKSNIMLGKKATKVFTATENMQQFFPASKIVVTGNPVRKSIVDGHVSKEEALNFFGLNKDKKVVLSIGGSLGAQSINEAIDKDIQLFEENNLQLIWQTGKPYLQKAKERVAGKAGVFVSDFITQMEYAYAAADIVISRSGAMAIAELCLVKKPVLFVPYPFAAEDHQTANAKELVNREAAIMISNNLAVKELVPAVVELAKDEALRTRMENNISKLAIANADVVIAKQILNSIS
ncbi:undecaprenyldiphospho-muramoylpentapeptide beta-N-acetylglucosaminyltransferase [Ferruginibacter sp. HRS2-29]|uniref:undecaprenyldiphospho-muramoylpentapeptide beta-N-acetylglucosaminyltransferase n=1 Tax=Ferruginibacter sp. HRS2-29 TaxID=2487334 RepID=UPI0020CD92F3|nr:undecaprenyldiphospho-muramoylpentapeptide beta-N-acetylglucosaminyltransferase [Ferruginibacter sp. HRS2-29]MCP9752505.1 undecaprenyldiphospho-muramoylpentapeptide beta-N-acetylglucosaminyltransferase [Ferruginibacter sp. HRS2-29]